MCFDPALQNLLLIDTDRMESGTLDDFWNRYVAAELGHQISEGRYETDRFGDSPDQATELARFVLSGRKTASCSSLWEWEAEGKELPRVGDRTIILDGHELPICIIETIEVQTRRFSEVYEGFAYDEGEDDRSLDSWRRSHWEFFSRVLPRIGRRPSLEMLLVCERFRVIFP
jgi:uncharacterized protein YhfF